MNKEDVARIAVEAALDFIEKRQQKEAKSRADRRLRNTRLLLRNYHLLKAHCDCSVYSIRQSAERPIDILDDIDALDRSTYIDAIKRSRTRTQIIIDHIDTMMELYLAYCEKSDKPEDLRRYRILKAVYFDRYTIPAVCTMENIDDSTYYRDSRDSIEKLSALIFGIDGLSSMRKT
ncbi:MAG: hypothetical protein RIN56_20310 [Sporomusaceae bacterium]|nr:hypothetical protein [Sporomusaceae bacterium]